MLSRSSGSHTATCTDVPGPRSSLLTLSRCLNDMEDTSTAQTLGLPFGRLPGPREMSLMSSDPWLDHFHPHCDREFFHEKPDADIFFPIRSRYLRGWHQRKPWPDAPLSTVDSSYIRTYPVTGADIPIEVVQRIAKTLSIDGQSRPGPATHKRDLGACALMCREWAPVCQAKIFNRITLRSAEDVRQLLCFLRDPTSRISRYIRDLCIPSQNMNTMPWIHHIPSLYPYLPHLPRELHGHANIDKPTTVSLQGPLLPSRGPLRSIHQALPRTAPSYSNHIGKLCLSNLHFRRFSDLADLVGEMPHLHYLDCDSLTSNSTPLPKPPSAIGQVPEVSMHNCDFSWASIWLYRNRRRGFSPWQVKLDQSDADRVGELSRTISSGFEGSHTRPTSKSHSIIQPSGVSSFYHHAIKITFSISPVQSIALVFMAKDFVPPAAGRARDEIPPQFDPNSRILHVYRVQLIFSFGDPREVQDYGFFTRIDWRNVDKTINSFPKLENVKLDFMVDTDFLNFISRSSDGTMLDELFARNKLAYSIKFGSQPFDWPMGVLTVGLSPCIAWSKMDQNTVLNAKLQIDASRAQLLRLVAAYKQSLMDAEHQPSAQPEAGSSLDEDCLSHADCPATTSQDHDRGQVAEQSFREGSVSDIDSNLLSGTPSSAMQTEASVRNMQNGIPSNGFQGAPGSSRTPDMQAVRGESSDGRKHRENGEAPRSGMHALNEEVARRYRGLRRQTLTVDWTDPAFPLVHIS
ncbi:hypothetical protein NM688_g6002 [Phlebia brevispora]|uniref:Uncharacterized protein n=1 Tax=Phlebia brevispora TaxID=194682 RepID=A0ACC1SLE6_9APHY|nr:hypothetical protein NM688_g6002 [Phlebia brevispora]